MKKIFSIAFILLLVFLGSTVWLKWYRMKRFEQSLYQRNALLKKDNTALLSEISRFKNTKFLDHYIREELGYLKSDEITYELRGSASGGGEEGSP